MDNPGTSQQQQNSYNIRVSICLGIYNFSRVDISTGIKIHLEIIQHKVKCYKSIIRYLNCLSVEEHILSKLIFTCDIPKLTSDGFLFNSLLQDQVVYQ